MKKGNMIWLGILLAFFVLASSHFVHAYYIIIKEDGKKVEGEIVEETDDYIWIKVPIKGYHGAYTTEHYKKVDIITEYEIKKQEEEKRKQEEAIKQEYERQQREKGLIEYKSKWVTKEELEKIKEAERIEEEKQERRLEQIKREKEEREKKEHEEYVKELRKQKLIKIGKIIGLIVLVIASLCLIVIIIRALYNLYKRVKELQKPEVEIDLKKGKANRYSSLIVLVVLLVVVFGFVRIYYGGGMGFNIVLKKSFSFKDTIVNLDDIFGMPRLAVATKHPAVKKQLEEMGVIQSDEQAQEEIRQEIQRETDRTMEKLKKQYGI